MKLILSRPLPARLKDRKPMNKMFAKKEKTMPPHIAHMPKKNRQEYNLASAQQNTKNLTFNLELN